jgi:hypothetical protein
MDKPPGAAMARRKVLGGIDMRRWTFDILMVLAGLSLAAILVIAGALMTWGHNFVDSQVGSQLAAQKIYFPATSNAEFTALPKADAAAMRPYAGQLMTNGAQAQAYADHFIAFHLQGIGGGLTYSQLSAKSLVAPANAKLAAQVQLMFRGTTLRSMLLEAYGFWQMGQIALIGAIASFAAAAALLVLSLLGLVHVRRVPRAAEVFGKASNSVQAQPV